MWRAVILISNLRRESVEKQKKLLESRSERIMECVMEDEDLLKRRNVRDLS